MAPAFGSMTLAFATTAPAFGSLAFATTAPAFGSTAFALATARPFPTEPLAGGLGGTAPAFAFPASAAVAFRASREKERLLAFTFALN